jgi:hypothetical protein
MAPSFAPFGRTPARRGDRARCRFTAACNGRDSRNCDGQGRVGGTNRDRTSRHLDGGKTDGNIHEYSFADADRETDGIAHEHTAADTDTDRDPTRHGITDAVTVRIPGTLRDAIEYGVSGSSLTDRRASDAGAGLAHTNPLRSPNGIRYASRVRHIAVRH